MMADITGMGQAQNKDAQAAQAGKARRAARWVGERIPGTSMKKDRLAREEADKVAREERVRHQTRKELESAVAPNIDPTTVKGEYTHSFNRQLLDAVRRGQTRTGSNTPDMLIRVTLTDPAFTNAIRAKAVPTPYEEADIEYARDMVKRRQTLAAWLDMARQHSDYTLPKLTNHEIDIIYSTALGRPDIWEGKDRKGRSAWPENKPNPAESVLRFLESVAMRERPGAEGDFIGNVLKDVAGRPTLLAADAAPGVKSDRKLVDGSYINGYLHKKSAEPIDSAVDNFRKLVNEVLSTPTSEVHAELGVPGVGYKDIFEGKLRDMNTVLGEARAAQKQAAAEAVAAQGTYDDVIATKEQAKGNWARLPEATRKQITDAETETRGILEQAKAREAGLSAEVSRIEGEVRKFRKESGIDSVTQELVDHFRAVLVQGNEVNADLSTIEAKLEPRLRNPAVANLLEQAQELFLEKRDSPKLATPEVAMILESINRALDERERLRPIVERVHEREREALLGRELRQLEADVQAIKATVGAAGFAPEMKLAMDEVVASTANFGIPRDYVDTKIRDIYLDDKAGRADAMLEAADLPVDTKVEIGKAFAALRKGGFADDAVRGEVAALMKASAFPLGRAAAISVKKLSRSDYENIVGITDAQRIVARMVWESTSSDSKDPAAHTEGRWMKFKQWLGWNFTTWEGFFVRRAVVWTYDTFLDGDIQDIRPKNALQKVSGKKPDGTPYKTRMPRIVSGISSLALKTYLVGAVAVWATHDASFSQHFFRSPVSISRKAPYVNPFVWWQSPPRPPSEVIRMIHDHYDIPDRLSGRPDAYLRDAYGLGRRLPGEQSDERANARVAWVKDHPDVMRFFQERRSMREVISWEETPHNTRNPDMCSTSARRIPPVCQDAQYGLNLGDAQAVQNYAPLDGSDGWRAEVPAMRVCCFVKLTTRPVSDGLMLNRSQSDRFVDALQAAERGGTRIDSAYMRDAGNRARWVQEWFMITPMENEIMETFRIRDRDNVQFILTQGSKVSNVLLPRCGERGEERELIQEAHRDEFVRLWREEIGRQYQGHNPTVEDVPQETLTASFNAVRSTAVNNHWVEDTTHEYDRRQVRRELTLLNLQTDTAIDAVLAQQDLHDFLKLFSTTSATYRINDQRSDEFVQVLVQHKMRNGSLNDFNPFAETQGARVQWAIGMGYLRQAEQFQSTQDRGNTAPGASGSAAQAQPPAPIPDLTPDAERFYASQSNESFRIFIEGITAGLHDDSRMDGRIMGDVLRTRFGGNRERMDRAIKAEVYRLITSTGDRDAALRGGYGISVTGSGDQMAVAMGNPRQARSSLRNHILQFVRAQGAIAVPPRR